jgi:DNA-binding GntR family transcriptional regulator
LAKPHTDLVLRHLRESVITGEFKRGEFLRLDRLASELGVSVTPVREALMQLRAEGLVEWQPRRGFQAVPLDRRDLDDVYRVQAFLAGELAARAVRELSDRDIEHLQQLQHELETAHAASDFPRVEDLNHRFHRAINQASDSPRLTWMLRTTTQFAPRLFFARIPGWSASSASDHRAVLEALSQRDPEAAAVAMSTHVERAGDLLAAYQEGRNDDAP